MAKHNTEFLESFVLQVLETHGVIDVTDEQKEAFVPFFVLYIQRTIGETLVHKLDNAGLDAVSDLLQDQNSDPQEWFNFFNTHIEDLQTEFEKTLEAFKKHVAQIVSQVQIEVSNEDKAAYKQINTSIVQMEKELRQVQRNTVSLRMKVNSIIDKQQIKSVLQGLVQE